MYHNPKHINAISGRFSPTFFFFPSYLLSIYMGKNTRKRSFGWIFQFILLFQFVRVNTKLNYYYRHYMNVRVPNILRWIVFTCFFFEIQFHKILFSFINRDWRVCMVTMPRLRLALFSCVCNNDTVDCWQYKRFEWICMKNGEESGIASTIFITLNMNWKCIRMSWTWYHLNLLHFAYQAHLIREMTWDMHQQTTRYLILLNIIYMAK